MYFFFINLFKTAIEFFCFVVLNINFEFVRYIRVTLMYIYKILLMYVK